MTAPTPRQRGSRDSLEQECAQLQREHRDLRQQIAAAVERERRAADWLREAFFPPLPARMPGFEVATFYQPAQREDLIGGDFYELFYLPGERLALVVGDVTGAGLAAAVCAIHAREMLRAYALEYPEPAAALGQLNAALHDRLPDERFVTLFFALLDPVAGTLRYASAGHEPPLLAHPHDPRVESLMPTGGLLGIERDLRFTDAEVPFAPGARLLVVTDGVTESRRGRERLGAARLAHAWRAAERGSAGDTVAEIQRWIETEGYQCCAQDDAAIVLMHRVVEAAS